MTPNKQEAGWAGWVIEPVLTVRKIDSFFPLPEFETRNIQTIPQSLYLEVNPTPSPAYRGY